MEQAAVTVRSWRHDAIALPNVRTLHRIDPRLAPPAALRLPVALVTRIDAGAAAAGFTLGTVSVNPHAQDVAEETRLRETLQPLVSAVDLAEPFERIRAAIEEAQRH